jgi:hypothetical protein
VVLVDHPSPHLPVLGLSFLNRKKIVGHSQLPDLCVQRPHRILIDLRRFLAAPLKDIGRAVQESLLALMDHRRMQAVFGGQFDTVCSPFTASSATLALNPASWFLRFFIF